MITAAELKAALPDLIGPQHFEVLRNGAVIRDRWGIPHIKSKDEYDLFFAQEFVYCAAGLYGCAVLGR